MPILEELIIIPNPEIQAIINDESPFREVEGVGSTAAFGGEVTISTTVSSTEGLPHV